ncbi:MAG: leucine-rich repeat protein, partial [Lachnospiraceae bacterium]|nr:leucine-rich repeat protein [Lachnospiraceae bacterium]
EKLLNYGFEQAPDHVYESVVTAPTATEQGYTTYTCTICGDSYIDTYTAVTTPTFTSTSDAVAYVRSQMVARVRPITVTISGAALSEAEVEGIINSAFEHTGVPNEGDYLLANKVGQTVSFETGTDENGDYTTITADINWISSAEQEAEVDAAVETILNELDLWNKTDYEKIKGAYDWITENVDYDYDWDDTEPDPNYHKHSTHAAIIDKEAVCQGYATLYYRFMLELGIDCRYISGTAGYVEPESHAWNIVRLEDKYYNMDPTWDRDLMGHYRMFLCTESNFTEHIRDSEYATAEFYEKYPMAVVPYVFNVTASGKLSNGMEWVLDGDTGTLTVAGKGAIPSYGSPSYAPWYEYRESIKSIVVSEGITEIGKRAFYWSTNCTSLTLPESLVTIREYGFNNLRALEEVTLPSNLKTMEFCAFSECVALKSITIPDSVTTVGTSVFSNCYGLESAVIGNGIKSIPNSMFFGDKKLSKVTLPEGLTYIGDTAFSDCGLKSITLPSTLTGLGSSVFSGNRTMTMIYVEEGNTAFKSVSGVLFSFDGKRLICYPAGTISFDYTVPAGTEVIARSAFNDVYRLENVYFPDSLREIEAYAFAYSNLWSVTLNENITKVGDSAFRSCKNLYSVILENQSVNLVGYTFADCTNLQIANLPTKITEIPNGLFDGCIKLAEVTIPSTVTKIGSSAFLDCDALTTITIPGSVKSIGQQAFDFCQNIKTIIFEEGVQSLGWLCIRNNPNLTKVVIPESVTTFVQPSNASSKTFESCPKVVLYVKCGSTAYNYAKSRGLSMSLTHNYANKTTVAPTCTEMGYTLYTCYCGASYRITTRMLLDTAMKPK